MHSTIKDRERAEQRSAADTWLALSLEDKYPELSSQQVADALRQAAYSYSAADALLAQLDAAESSVASPFNDFRVVTSVSTAVEQLTAVQPAPGKPGGTPSFARGIQAAFLQSRAPPSGQPRAVQDPQAQAVVVELPGALEPFVSSSPHITISVQPGTPFKRAGDLVGQALADDIGPECHMEMLLNLRLPARVGVKTADGSVCYSMDELTAHLLQMVRAPRMPSSILQQPQDAQAAYAHLGVGSAFDDWDSSDDDSAAIQELDALLSSAAAPEFRKISLLRRDPASRDRERQQDLDDLRKAQVDVAQSDADVDRLMLRFPSLDRGLAKAVLQDCENDLQAATRCLGGPPSVLSPREWELLAQHERDPAAAVAAALASAGEAIEERKRMHEVADAERRTAYLHRTARTIYFEAAKSAYEQGDKDLAVELASKGREHNALFHDTRRLANETAFTGSNLHVVNRLKVDLHGLHVDEAIRKLEKYLFNLKELGHAGGILLQVITGVGKHSIEGKARILPAVIGYLKLNGYQYGREPDNPGVINVRIGPQGRLK
ncbi:hypothetical protein WJX72_000676 [[Myrmecia] bisecta]|uniref:Smr domain-containing protein n=1 Tax=[Myrmecia] bisecta TaxID=41462 RepID=A0AAW1R420_9CHLO